MAPGAAVLLPEPGFQLAQLRFEFGILHRSAHPCQHTNKSSLPQLRQIHEVNGYDETLEL